jgi:hypothetical protein
MKYTLSFSQFIFENFGEGRLDFCLDVLREYKKVGKGFEDLPEQIKKCLQSNGQTDFSTALGSIYDEYIENGNSFTGMSNPVEKIDTTSRIDNFSKKLADMPSEAPKGSMISDKMKIVSDTILKYGNSIQFSIVPDEEYADSNAVVIAGRKVTIDRIFDNLIDLLGEEKLMFSSTEDYYSEIIILLNNRELERLENYLGGMA